MVDTPQYFLTVSNGRSGSTWLITSLAMLPDVSADFEVKFAPSVNFELVDSHLLLTPGGPGFPSLIAQRLENAPIMGSKLVLDYHKAFSAADIDALCEAVTPDVRIVHLTRPYADMMKSFARGVTNVLNPNFVPQDKQKAQAHFKNVGQMSERSVKDLRLYLVRQQFDYAMLKARRLGGQKWKKVYFLDFVRRLLVLFFNDLVLTELARRSQSSMTVAYKDIGTKLQDIGTFIGSQAGAEDYKRILEAPMTKKLEPRADRIINWALLEEICHTLDAGLAEHRKSGAPLSDVWSFTRGSDEVEVRLPGLGRLTREGIARGDRGRLVDDDTLRVDLRATGWHLFA